MKKILKSIVLILTILLTLLPFNASALTETQSGRMCCTWEEYHLLCRVCMSECGGKYGEPLEGKVAVVETILNRCMVFEKSIEEVVYEPYQYSLKYNGEPDETVEQAVHIALEKRMYPKEMIYFRTLHYHNFGTPYRQIGNHYFSLDWR